ncbi:MAG: molybdopterin biosynthesis protein [Actinomycetota bacterium]|nr:molybdopterin biosynthesis protein [Actinomycetota bacterium]
MRRNIFLENTPLEEALSRWLSLCRLEGVCFPTESEFVDVRNSVGRITAESLFALISSPPFNSSAMDGVAVRAKETFGASEDNPAVFELGRNAQYIDTGEPVPPEFDAVIMIEDVNELESGSIEIIKPAVPWQNIRPIGEDITRGEMVLPGGHQVRAQDVGALLNSGLEKIPVRRKPIVAIIPTGTELVENLCLLEQGKVIESNSWALLSLVEHLGGFPLRNKLVPDDWDEIRRAVENALESSDAVIINAGTSAGREDFTKKIIEEFGKVSIHGVAMKPGKPVILGVACGKPVLGLPGFPVANWRAAEEFLKPLLREFLGRRREKEKVIRAKVARRISSRSGFDEFIGVKVGEVSGELIAVPLSRGSGISMSLVRSDGYIRVKRGCEGIERLDEVEVFLKGEQFDPERVVLVIGSNDHGLDILSSLLFRNYGLVFSAVNVGSAGGIAAVIDGYAHMGGIHLFDPKSGEFNVPYIKEKQTSERLFLMNLCWRTQGLIVKEGNPKNINSLKDIAGKGLSFINRQRGSGTRILLDYLLFKENIKPSSINGYEREVFTHMAVAAAVESDSADAGLGTMASAKALSLDFVPVSKERYDLLGRRSFTETEAFNLIRREIKGEEFKNEVDRLGGYDLEQAGEFIPIDL